jgi:hypothetical protein
MTVVNGNHRPINPGDPPTTARGWRRGIRVQRRRPRADQAETGVVIHVNRIGMRRLRVLWDDDTRSNVSVRSVVRIS